MSSTLREIREVFLRSVLQPRFWGTFVAIIVLFSFVGPFGTFGSMSVGERFAYWTTTMLGSWLLAITCISILQGIFVPRTGHPFLFMMIGTAVSAFPIAVWLDISMRWFIELPPEFDFLRLFGYALPICLVFGFIVYFVLTHVFHGDADENRTDEPNILLRRLPVSKRGPVKYMSMQDHYIEIVTTKGREMVLMRMADAVDALGPLKGLQVHRSHWVGKDYVTDVRRQNGQHMLVMDDGVALPVSRTYAKAVRDAGLI